MHKIIYQKPPDDMDPDEFNKGTYPFTKKIASFSPGVQGLKIQVLRAPSLRGVEDVVVKEIVQSDYKDKNDAAVIETTVSTLATSLVLRQQTPNIALIFGGRAFSVPRQKVAGRNPQQYNLFFERCSMNLSKKFERTSRSHSVKQWFSMLFQVIHGLHAMHSAGIIHADFHTENVLVCPTKHKNIYYEMDGYVFTVPTYGYVYKAYDMGNAYAKGPLDRAQKYKIGNYRNKKLKPKHLMLYRPDIDIIKLFHWLYLENNRKKIPKVVQDFMYDVLTNDGKNKWEVKEVKADLKVRGRQDRFMGYMFENRKPPKSGIINPKAADLGKLLLYIGKKYFRTSERRASRISRDNIFHLTSRNPHLTRKARK